LPDISEVNGTAISNLAEVDGLTVSGGGSSFTGLLDQTYGSGAAAAYSVRRLSSSTGALIRVRRVTGVGNTGNDDEADFSYDSNNELSLDSPISNADAGVNSTTLGSFLNVGTVSGVTYPDTDSLTNTAEGYCDSWYDQSGNSNDAIQSTPGSQPPIHSGTVNTDLITENGKPALDFDATNDLPISTQFLTNPATDPEKHVVCVLSPTRRYTGPYSIRQPYDFSQTSSGTVYVGMTIREAAGGVRTIIVTDNTGAAKEESSADTTQQQNLVSHSMDLTSGARVQNAYLNGSLMTGTAVGYNSGSANQISNAYSFVRDYTGSMQELIVWNADKTSERTDIDSNINSYYTIY
jgi:hypothetical protein